MSGVGDFLFGSKPKLEKGFITPRLGDIPIKGASVLPFVQDLFGIAGQDIFEFEPQRVPGIELGEPGDFTTLPEGSTEIGGGLFSRSAPRAKVGVDTSCLDDAPVISTDPSTVLKSFQGLDLTLPSPPDIARDFPRIEAPEIPKELGRISEIESPTFGRSRAENRFLDEVLDELFSLGAVRGQTPDLRGGFKGSKEAIAKAIAGPISDFRQQRVENLLGERELADKARSDTIESITSIFGDEVAQRATDVAASQQTFDTQSETVSGLIKQKGVLEVKLKEIQVTAATERTRLQTQLEIAEVEANLVREQQILDAATSIAQLGQGTAISGALQGQEGFLQSAGGAAVGAGVAVAV